MAYVNRLEINNTTSTGLMVADSAVRADADAKVVNLTNHAVAKTCIVSGGTLQALNQTSSDCLIDGAKVYGGQLIVRFAGNSGANWELYGGNAYLQSNAAVSKVDIYDGGILNTYVGTATDVTVHNGGKTILQAQSKIVWNNLDVRAGGSVTLAANFAIQNNINIEDGAVICLSTGANPPLANVSAHNGIIYNFTHNANIAGSFGHGITLSNFTQTVGTVNLVGDGIADGGTVTGGTFQALDNNGADGARIRNVTFDGGTMIVRGATNKADLLTQIGAGTLHVQQGASATNVTQRAGTINVSGLAGAYCYVSALAISGGSTILTKWANAHDITMTGGNLYVNNSANAYAITQNAGETLISGTSAVALGITQNAGTLAVSTGGVASNVTQTAGNFFVSGGGIASNVTQNGGYLYVSNGGILSGGKNVAGMATYVYSGGTAIDFDTVARGWVSSGGVWSGGTISGTEVDNYDKAGGGVIRGTVINGGSAIIRWAGNLGDTITVETGKLYIQSGASGAKITLNGGEVSITNAGSIIDGLTYNAGTFGVHSGTTVKNLQKVGATTVNLYGNGIVDGGAVSAGYLQALVGNGADGAVIKNYAISAGGAIIVRGETNRAENITISAGTMHVQGGATVNGAEVLNGGTIVNNNIANEVVSNLTLRTGAIGSFTAGTGRLVGLTMEDGATLTLTAGDVSGGAAAGGTLNFTDVNLYDFAMTGGVLNAAGTLKASGGTLLNVNQTAGAIRISGGATLNGGTIAKDIYLASGGTARNIEVNGASGKLYVYSSGVAEDVVLGADTTANRIYVSSGGVAKRAIVRGGEFYVHDAAGGGYASDVKVSGGRLIVRSAGNIASNVTVYGGEAYAQSAALISGATVSGGDLIIEAGASGADIVQSAGRVYAHRTTIGNLTVVGGETDVYHTAGNGLLSGGIIRGGQVIIRFVGNSGREVAVSEGGLFHVQRGASASDIDVTGGIMYVSGSGANISEADTVRVTGGAVIVNNLGVAKDIDMTGGAVSATAGGVVSAVAGNTLHNANTVAGAKICFVKDGDHATLVGDKTNIAEGTLWYEGTTQLTGHGANGVIEGLGAGTGVYKLSIGNDIVLKDATGNNTEVRVSCFDGAKIDGMLLGAGAIIGHLGASVEFDRVTLSAGHGNTCNLNLSGGGQTASNTVIGGSGAKLQIFGADAKIENTTIKAGGSMNLAVDGADTGKLVTLDFSGTTGDQFVDITNLGRLAADTALAVRGFESGATYTFTKGASATDKTLDLGKYRVFDMAVAAGSKYSNGFLGLSYDFTTGKSLTVTTETVGTQVAAAELTSANATVLADGGLATKWDGTTDLSVVPAAVAGANTTGDAWLTVNEADLATALYGAEGNFAHDVNLWLYKGTVRNLAAGAAAGGSVGNVNLLVGDTDVTDADITFTGVAYAGGFGNVTGKTGSIVYKGTFQKDFYAGALANYAKTSAATTAGDIALTVKGGEFSGNLYGASAVKASVANAHTAGNVSLTLAGGNTTKADFCCFAGGYATGGAAEATVYTVNNIDAEVSGGTWGEARGGRGFFGGAFASGVTAEAQDVTITISGGTIGNVYGGGWAQKGGTSIADDVEIVITGGNITNVFGGGAHSVTAPGGATTVDDVAITVAGGSISGAIYAGGQGVGDDVTGDEIGVNFTGNANFACGVYGYSYGGGTIGDAALSYTGYTGTFSGAVGGFAGITFDGGTAMTLATAAADVSNGKWEFDFTDRADTLAGTSFLTWDNADFAGDTVKVNFADAEQAQAGWNIADAAFDATTTFTLAIGGTEITTVAYDTAIAEGDWTGWKFTDENGTLKFKPLA